jgi:predicted RNase H-like nuclease (RuvC/YqgF family)
MNAVIALVTIDVILAVLVFLKYKNIFDITYHARRFVRYVKGFKLVNTNNQPTYTDETYEQQFESSDEDDAEFLQNKVDSLEDENSELRSKIRALQACNENQMHSIEDLDEKVKELDALLEVQTNATINITEQAGRYQAALERISKLHRPVGKNAGIKLAREALGVDHGEV